MVSKKKNRLAPIIIVFFFVTNVYAQSTPCGFQYGKTEKDSLFCFEEVFLFKTSYNNADYQDAYLHWKTIVDLCPCSWNAIFNTVYLQNMFDDLIQNTDNKEQKDKYLEEWLNSIGNRHLYFPKSYTEGAGLGLKAYYSLLNKKNSKEELKQAHDLFVQSIQMEKEKTQPAIWDVFFRLTEQLASGKRDSTLLINALELAVEYFDFEQYKFPPILKKMWLTLNNMGSTHSAVFKKILKMLHQEEPTVQTAQLLAYYSLEQKAEETALSFFKEALELSAANEQKAEVWYSMALIYQRQDNYMEAREAARQAIKLNSNCGKAYILIGDLYAASSSKCSGSNSMPFDYNWAAADKYTRAIEIDPTVAELAAMKRAKLRFPSEEDKFQRGYTKSGTPYKVECWIQETTFVR